MTPLLHIFLRDFAVPAPAPLVPELCMWTTPRLTGFWEACQSATGNPDLDLPYWAIVWPGGAGLARFVLDHPERFRGQRVLDLACGSGIVAMAAARVGAHVTANDLDEDALALCRMAAQLNGVKLAERQGDLLDDRPPPEFDTILAGDIFYERTLAERSMRWLRMATECGVHCWIGDAQRLYRPSSGLVHIATYTVPVMLEVEGQATSQVDIVCSL